ncbi:MAG: GGDEF domain-containing protein [Oscillospiraceae bacterium]|nr:GGDEF domain-containing protein [Oscillospiraceae bacterium]
MNLESIIITNCMGCAILLILLISSYFVRQRRTSEDKIFTLMIFLTISACMGEMLTYMIDGRDRPWVYPCALLGNTWLYFANIAVSFLWCLYTDLRLYRSEERIRRYYKWIGLPAAVFTVVLLLNLRMQFLFCIDENNIYHRLPVGYLYYIPTVGYLAYSIVLRYRYYLRCHRDEFFPIWMFMAPVLVGATVQGLVYGISVAWCSVALGLVGLYMSLQNELSYLDPLTRLYNRSYLDRTLQEMRKRGQHVGGLMIDVDYFKSINDRFGHTVGDQALLDVAQILRSAIPAKAILVRFAGDEFVILQRARDSREIEQTVQAVREALSCFNQSAGRPYELSLSIGTALEDLGQVSADAFLSDMDDRMYEMKNATHHQAAIS